MKFDCFFCQNPLILFKDEEKSGNYPSHYACYECGDTYSNMDWIEVRRRPHCICLADDNQIESTSLYFKKSKIWMETFYWDRPMTNIMGDDWKFILRVPISIDVFRYTPEALEKKIKMWILFS